MTTERTATMEKARAKRQRRTEVKAAKKAARLARPQAADPGARFADKVVDLAQGAVAHVGEVVKAAAAKLSFTD